MWLRTGRTQSIHQFMLMPRCAKPLLPSTADIEIIIARPPPLRRRGSGGLSAASAALFRLASPRWGLGKVSFVSPADLTAAWLAGKPESRRLAPAQRSPGEWEG